MNPFLPLLAALFLRQPGEIPIDKGISYFKFTPEVRCLVPVIINSVKYKNDFPYEAPMLIDCSDIRSKKLIITPNVKYEMPGVPITAEGLPIINHSKQPTNRDSTPVNYSFTTIPANHNNNVRLTKEVIVEQNPNILERLNNLTGCPLKISKQDGLPKGFFKDTTKHYEMICNGNTLSNSKYVIILDNHIYEGDLKNLNPNNIKSITILKDDPIGMYSQINTPTIVIISKKT